MRSLFAVFLVLALFLWVFPRLGPSLSAQDVEEKPPAAKGAPPEKGGKGGGREDRKPPKGALERPAGIPERRWESLSEEKKRELKKRFEHFMRLPPQKRRLLEKRHQELERLRREIEKKSEKELENLPPAERRRIIDERVRRELRNLEKRIGTGNIPGGIPPGELDERKVEKMRRVLEERTRRLATRRLAQLRKEGIITGDEERRVRLLPLREMVVWILDRQKEAALQTLDGVTPPKELERFRKMPPHRFHEELRRRERDRTFFGAYAMLSELTEEQKAAVGTLPAGEERERLKRFFHDENLRSRLEAMGVGRRETDDLLSMPLSLRIRRVMSLVKRIPPENLLPGLRGMLGGPPQRGKGRHRTPPPPPRSRAGPPPPPMEKETPLGP